MAVRGEAGSATSSDRFVFPFHPLGAAQILVRRTPLYQRLLACLLPNLAALRLRLFAPSLVQGIRYWVCCALLVPHLFLFFVLDSVSGAGLVATTG